MIANLSLARKSRDPCCEGKSRRKAHPLARPVRPSPPLASPAYRRLPLSPEQCHPYATFAMLRLMWCAIVHLEPLGPRSKVYRPCAGGPAIRNSQTDLWTPRTRSRNVLARHRAITDHNDRNSKTEFLNRPLDTSNAFASRDDARKSR